MDLWKPSIVGDFPELVFLFSVVQVLERLLWQFCKHFAFPTWICVIYFHYDNNSNALNKVLRIFKPRSSMNDSYILRRTYRGSHWWGWSDVLISHLPGLSGVGLVGCSYIALTGAVGGGVGRMFLCRTYRGCRGRGW